MGRQGRLELITEIERARRSRVLCYVTGDRRGLETKVASDTFTYVHSHLREMGKVKNLDLFLYSVGGITIAAWGLVNLLREFCDHLGVLIPFKAHSAATLVALGADEIIMGKLGQLTPIDPSVASPYNPAVPGQQQPGTASVLPVSVEDVVGFLNLAKEEAGLTEGEDLGAAFQALGSKVHPLALGSVYRARQQIRMLAKKLLAFHMRSRKAIERIVNTLTKGLYSHDYLIGRTEAKGVLGPKVVDVTTELEDTIWKLYTEYEGLLELTKPYQHDVILGESDSSTVVLKRAVIETTSRTDAYESVREIRRVQATQPGIPFPVQGFQEKTLRDGWVLEVDY